MLLIQAKNTIKYLTIILQSTPPKNLMMGFEVTIAIRKDLKFIKKYKLEEAYLVILITASVGDLAVTAAYQPPRLRYLSIPNFSQLFAHNSMAILTGHFNARCRASSYTSTNNVGRNLEMYIDRGILEKSGFNEEVLTYTSKMAATKPDIVLNSLSLPFNVLLTQDHLRLVTPNL